MRAKAYNRLIGIVLAVEAAIFLLLLAGAGSGLLTNPPAP
jgi:hypothetical protein